MMLHDVPYFFVDLDTNFSVDGQGSMGLTVRINPAQLHAIADATAAGVARASNTTQDELYEFLDFLIHDSEMRDKFAVYQAKRRILEGHGES